MTALSICTYMHMCASMCECVCECGCMLACYGGDQVVKVVCDKVVEAPPSIARKLGKINARAVFCLTPAV